MNRRFAVSDKCMVEAFGNPKSFGYIQSVGNGYYTVLVWNDKYCVYYSTIRARG